MIDLIGTIYTSLLSAWYTFIFRTFFTEIIAPLVKVWNGGASYIVSETFFSTFPFPWAKTEDLQNWINTLDFLLSIVFTASTQVYYFLDQLLNILNLNNLLDIVSEILTSTNLVLQIFQAATGRSFPHSLDGKS